jgi:hypothetical protein
VNNGLKRCDRKWPWTNLRNYLGTVLSFENVGSEVLTFVTIKTAASEWDNVCVVWQTFSGILRKLAVPIFRTDGEAKQEAHSKQMKCCLLSACCLLGSHEYEGNTFL